MERSRDVRGMALGLGGAAMGMFWFVWLAARYWHEAWMPVAAAPICLFVVIMIMGAADSYEVAMRDEKGNRVHHS